MKRQGPLQQVYKNYTEEDFRVWKALCERQAPALLEKASATYLDAARELNFSSGEIPLISEINRQLLAATGWTIQIVSGHVPARDFFELLSRKVFPATCWIRSWTEIDYVEEPDMFHDVFGHTPLLLNPLYASFMERFGALALEVFESSFAIELLSRLYWYTIEFGLISERDKTKIYGAGIVSSPSETKSATGTTVNIRKFDVTEVLSLPFETDKIQDTYFVIKDFAQLSSALEIVQAEIYALSEQQST